jgi:hypothetical protein
VDLDRGHGWGVYGVFPALEESGVSWFVGEVVVRLRG